MDNIKINEQIIDAIQKQCEDDPIIEDFLVNLIYEEADHPGQWWWKDTYKKMIEKYLAKWEVKNEN